MLLAPKANGAVLASHSPIEEIRFDYKTRAYFVALALYLLVTTCVGINGSSVGRWANVFGDTSARTNILGTAKAIRSDEWAIQTPAILSQCNTSPRFPTENYSLGASKAPLLMSVPVKHFSTFLRPQFWLFFVADVDRAFAFYWSMKAVSLLSGMFLLLMLILRNNFALSLFGSLWVFSSGYIQWWFSSPQMWPELVGSFALLTASLAQIIISRRKESIIVFSILFIVSSFNFVVVLYPPHQVPLAYLGCFLFIGMLAPQLRPIYIELLRNRFRLWSLIAALAISAIVLFLFYSDARQTLEALGDTVFPGRRRSSGGEGSLSDIFNGFLGMFTTEEKFPKDNVCESSNFFLFFPIPAVLLCWDILKRKKAALLESILGCYIAVILIWSFFGFPAIVAKFSLFDRVAWPRPVLALGIASIIWTCLFCHKLAQQNLNYSFGLRIVVTGIMGAALFAHTLYLKSGSAPFIGTQQVLLVTAFVTLTCWLLVAGKAVWFMLAVIVANVSAFGLVNPVRVGLSPITRNNLYSSVRQIVDQDPGAKWVVYGNPVLANLAYATGARVLNGLKYVPHLNEMRQLSDKDEDVAVYNRYGFISLSPTTEPTVRFQSADIEDSYTLIIDPHSESWRRLGITYVLMPEEGGMTLLRANSR